MNTVEERFWEKVDKTGECWIWTASIRGQGYGQCSTGNGRQGYAHRFSYEMANGQVPDGLVVDHICHVRLCVNPDHLRAVTHKQNMENRSGAVKGSTSGIRGASWVGRLNKWVAQVRHNHETHYLGLYETAKEAASAAEEKRLQLFTHNDLDRKCHD